jgi:hypothetical protein
MELQITVGFLNVIIIIIDLHKQTSTRYKYACKNILGKTLKNEVEKSREEGISVIKADEQMTRIWTI